ncbi:MAG: DUF3137 domain-containing protein [Novosphingobium sp.]
MLERPDPDALLAGELGQWLAGEGTMRDAARARASRIQTLAIAAACVVAVLVLLVSRSGVVGALQMGFFVGAAGLGWAEWSKRPAIRAIKGGMNEAIARALRMEYFVAARPGAEFQLARNFDMLPSFERSSFEDMWRGSIGDRSFQLYETKLEQRRNSGKNRSWETVFQGSLITLDFARRFHGVTLIERAGRRKKLFGLLGEKDAIILDGVRLGRVDMVDPRFDREFAVWTNDQVEARYLVHPDYVERLMAVEQAFAGEKVRGLFKDGQLLIVLESGNLFESGSLDAGQDRQLLARTIEQFGSLTDLAARLNERARMSA